MTQEPAWHPSDIAPIPDPDADGPKRRGRIPQSAWPRILDMHRSGVTLTAIAREFDCTPSAISYIVRKAEGAVPKAGETDTPDMPPLIAAIETPVSAAPVAPVVTAPPVIREESTVSVAPAAVEAPVMTSEPVADSAVGRVEPTRGDYSRPEPPNRDVRPQQGRYAERQGGERPSGERIGNDQGRRPPVSMGSPNGPRPNYQPGPRPDRPAGERPMADRVPGDRQGPPPERQPGVERYGQDRQGPDRQGQERQGQDRMAGPRPNGDRFGGERRPNDRIQGDRNMGERNQGDRFQNERTPYDRSAQQRAEGERAFADRGPDRNVDRAERFQGERPERIQPERVMPERVAQERLQPERTAPVLPDVLPPDNFSGTGPSDVVYPYRQQRHAGRIEASETPTVPADQRMAATATACADAFRAWKAAPATVGTQPLADSLHELRRVIARMEIEMSASRREEQRPLPIPNYRFNHAPPQQPRG
jgi:hypothetical protein